MEKTRRVAGLSGAALLAALAVLRGVASATETSVFFAGYELRWVCLLKGLFGFQCPSCGLTRSSLLALGGDLDAALSLNPGGPLLVLGAILLGVSLVVIALRPAANDARFGVALARLKLCASAYGVLTLGVVLARWALRVA
ncbi:MAG: DUF2752 domain-containing protein [Acidobacteria bacterium]|nr:DUF2752 domain-containing protein [Acidobacteriota bacterium]